MKMRSLRGSKLWVLVVDDFSDFTWGRFISKKSDLNKNITPILEKLCQTYYGSGTDKM